MVRPIPDERCALPAAAAELLLPTETSAVNALATALALCDRAAGTRGLRAAKIALQAAAEAGIAPAEAARAAAGCLLYDVGLLAGDRAVGPRLVEESGELRRLAVLLGPPREPAGDRRDAKALVDAVVAYVSDAPGAGRHPLGAVVARAARTVGQAALGSAARRSLRRGAKAPADPVAGDATALLAAVEGAVFHGDAELARRLVRLMRESWAGAGPEVVMAVEVAAALCAEGEGDMTGFGAHVDLAGLALSAARGPLGFELTLQAARVERWAGELKASQRRLTRAVRAARAGENHAELSPLLVSLSCSEWLMGRYAACRAHAEEAERLAAGLGFERVAALAMMFQGVVAAMQGRAAAARELTQRIWDYAERRHDSDLLVAGYRVLAILTLSIDPPEEAARHIDGAAAALDQLGLGNWFLDPDGSLDHAEALVRAGRLDEARAVLAQVAGPLEATGMPIYRSRVWRAKAMAGGCDGDYERALAHHPPDDRVETARTRLERGIALLAAGEERRGRTELRQALAVFEEVGAQPWAERARRALGEAVEVVVQLADPLLLLGPEQARIAQLVAAGRTNVQVAEAVTVSVKTVEYHLTRIYRVLGVGSRAELAAAVARAESAGAPSRD